MFEEIEEDADRLWDRGMDLMDAEEWVEAEAVFLRILQIEPSYNGSYSHLSLIHAKLKDPEKALFYSMKAVESGCEEADTYLGMGIALNRLKRYEEALQPLYKALQVDSSKWKIHAYLGYVLFNLERYEECIPFYETALEIGPKRLNIYKNLGFAYKHIGNIQKAIRYHRQAIGLDPTSSVAWVYLGFDYQQLLQEKKALSCFEKAIQLSPESAWAMTHCATSLYRMRRFEAALPLYEKTVKLNPEDGYAWYGLGELCRMKKDYEEACAHYRKAIRLLPDHAWARFQLGCCSIKIDQWGEANAQLPALRHLDDALACRLETLMELSEEDAQKQYITLIILTSFCLWWICWKLGGWVSWFGGSLFLTMGLASASAMKLEITDRVREEVSVPVKVAVLHGIVGFWLGFIGAPPVSLTVLGTLIALLTLSDANNCQQSQSFHLEKTLHSFKSIMLPAAIAVISCYALGHGMTSR